METNAAAMPRPAALGLSILSAVLVLIALTDAFAEPDLWGYLNFGRMFFNEPGFPCRDFLAYTPTHPDWVFHEWLTGVVLYRLWEATGPAGIQVLKYILGCLTAFLLFLASRRRGAALKHSLYFFLAGGAFFSWAFPAFRALCFTYFFFALFIFVLETARINENFRRLWILPLIMALWANLHGGFPAGLGLIGLYAAGRFWEGRRYSSYLKVLAVCILATLINPYGLGLWTAIAGHLAEPQAGVREWVSVPGAWVHFGPSYDLLIFLACVGFALGMLVLYGFQDKVFTLIFLTTAFLGMVHHRHMPFLVLAAGAYGPFLFQEVCCGEKRKTKVRTCAILFVLLFALVMAACNIKYFVLKTPIVINGGNPLALNTPAQPYAPGTDALFYPVHAVDYLETAGFSGNILPYATWGGYVSWRLYPRCKVAMDLRFETVYPKKVRDEYFRFLQAGAGWRDFLVRHPHDIVLIYRGGALHKSMSREPGWREIYKDENTVIFSKEGG
ncbi:hypothetical protein SAMN02745216_02418 [Desulfatibacillum alkenivorans DSM 16219]|jgi:hypothetical protein|uniref:Dolichyl-phosphate-mannose-protein mannosyltransferase n=1 Tax=Desulfatibacillum alkenivorans DSM 16219 TaxID=1121393 RepID=A0A1M6MS17_9BACT|nr:hypothetical protein [Desulfatibacillum alkenivorans]SHJ86180.1 hypothetical protein SAMN02745216_02418 [Desulfatibacillum alkenivorans DSM 16219]